MSELNEQSQGQPPAGKEAPERRHVWDNPKNVQILIWTFLASCGVVFAVDLFVHRHASFEHGEMPWEQSFGFYSLYGFAACVLLVVVAKQVRRIVMRGEEYYGDAPAPLDPPEQPGGPKH